jgi:acyl-CoA synthetase (NDP forming)
MFLSMTFIAVVGASTNRRKFGNKCVRAYKERGDTVYPIHPVHEEVEELKAYRSVLDVPHEIEVASFYVPSQVGCEYSKSAHRRASRSAAQLRRRKRRDFATRARTWHRNQRDLFDYFGRTHTGRALNMKCVAQGELV